ncbi:MAG: hypothetical protein US15_C0036G0006 [Candidatus Moranbacteria bacterium GW2011_GWF1_36_4]|nr:MAG: hypothetical protein US15_C0036G0006 [Candidatus Moranbacteria bacterium GW2011_GWF1_36_4]
MSKLKVTDFYYGAVLSTLFNNHFKPALVEGGDDRQVYDLTTDNNAFRLFIKYCGEKKNTKTEDYNSWTFGLNDSDKKEILSYIANGYNLMVALLCGVEGLAESEIAVLSKEKIQQIIELEKTSITISRKKSERAFRISIGNGRENAIQIKANIFDEMKGI